MIPKCVYINNIELARRFKSVNGDIVECGVWRGGMIAGLSEIFNTNRTYHLFDSFEGLPEAKEIDGEAAINWQKNTTSEIYYDNCKAEVEFAQKAMKLAKIDNTRFHKGWFNETLKEYKSDKGIAILRMDADWYDSTMDIMNILFPLVNKGGLIIIDDYYAWDGCSKAIHDYLSRENRTERIYQKNEMVAYIIKK